MKTLVITNSKYNTTNTIAKRIKEVVDVDVIELKNIKHCDFSSYENIVFISSIYKGKAIHNTKKIIKSQTDSFKDKNIYLCYCSAKENSQYLQECYDEKLIEEAKATFWFGSTIDVSLLSFFDKLILSIVRQKNNHENINIQNIDELIKLIK